MASAATEMRAVPANVMYPVPNGIVIFQLGARVVRICIVYARGAPCVANTSTRPGNIVYVVVQLLHIGCVILNADMSVTGNVKASNIDVISLVPPGAVVAR